MSFYFAPTNNTYDAYHGPTFKLSTGILLSKLQCLAGDTRLNSPMTLLISQNQTGHSAAEPFLRPQRPAFTFPPTIFMLGSFCKVGVSDVMCIHSS